MSSVLTANSPIGAAPLKSRQPVKRAASWGGLASLGKYREIIIAVALFLLFDLGVLVLNFYTSFKIDQDTVAINLSGRQRYVSQRVARTLLELDAMRTAGLPYKPETLAELRNGTKIFQMSHVAFREGGTIPGGDGKPVYLEPVVSERGRELEDKVETLWRPYYELLQPLMRNDDFAPGQLAAALTYSQANNIKLLGVANDFVTETQQIGASRASVLRMVQTGGIILALLNFAFILFKFLRRLNTSDAAIEAANEENREILTSVREGLFLLTPEHQLGSQLSSSAHDLFGKTLAPGQDFFELLSTLVSEKALKDAQDYVELLFSPHVKEKLIQGINPLAEVELTVKNRLGQNTARYLSFYFNRVQDGGTVRHLLVTVQDITQKVELQARLTEERQRSQKELSMMLKAFETDPAMMRMFVERAEVSLLEVNDLLRSTSSATSETQVLKAVDGAYRRIHAIKGDAASMGLEILASLAHQFESELQKLKDSGAATGDALLALPLPLEDLLSKVAAFKKLSQNRSASPALPTQESVLQGLNASLAKLAGDVAVDCGKRVNATVRMGSALDMPADKMDLVREVAVQLVRNAVVHGVEAPLTRLACNKAAEGQVEVNLGRDEGGQWLLSVRDDGAGLDPVHVRRRLLELKWYTAEQLESFSDKQIASQIFKPGFSTAEATSQHAGRGVGLDLVQSNVQRLGARLLLSSNPGQHTEFKIYFAA
ncbi:ATP-binding protein [Polaromonas naphthalenivorans]|uniref:histidine kinase n=1 Tax=Polaromonas naphthalenivorans (strain CJ2) TaxID=365044 RepID=A1VMX9_POLNA|nr:ATP-binding protein [Polaromonas naphthalenivorans]ABM37007.1 CheA signal transduction histidine kinases [Polaromonas naphthalenivorans CJ2]